MLISTHRREDDFEREVPYASHEIAEDSKSRSKHQIHANLPVLMRAVQKLKGTSMFLLLNVRTYKSFR